jgi:hypothetical protein
MIYLTLQPQIEKRCGTSSEYCGVMKLLADMPSCLGGEDYRINVA